jgi:enediyne polyketide synthase
VNSPIAVVGMACRYPDTGSPGQLWENVLAGRRAFRTIPPERMSLDDYWSPDAAAPDRFYASKAAVLEGWEFDRVRYRVPGSTYRGTDMTHWLALDTAAAALADAGLTDGGGLPRPTTAVIVGNTLTGEFARANLMRLRWPYVRRTLGEALSDLDWEPDAIARFLADVEARYKSPFPAIDEDTLAGGLSNTIAGRICNHFDLNGGGFTVDGACSSSLLSVLTACSLLSDGRADAAIAGGVDLSIDPFEVIGFAKTGALATSEMRVYDKHSNGFWPGEGCGMLVLLRAEEARARGLRSYATIAGWGFSTDGSGGITRPEADGQRLAIDRAYAMAGIDVGSVGYFEGHGTGTAVGDATELRALGAARRATRPDGPAAALGSIKGNIGHTKAAAGAAGLIKAVLAVHHQVIPPATSHVEPHPELLGERPALRVPTAAEPWPRDLPVHAGVSAMGFGGVNAHLVVTGDAASRRRDLDPNVARLVNGRQDCELLLLDGADVAEVRALTVAVAALVPQLSYAELTDLAATLQERLSGGPVRAAVVAASPEQAVQRLGVLLAALDHGSPLKLGAAGGVFLAVGRTAPRIGFLFPGQGSGRPGTGALPRRFPRVSELYQELAMPENGNLTGTEVAQPRIVTSSMAGLRALSQLGIVATGAVGHSLGELTALHWAGVMSEAEVHALATARGKAMAELGDSDGAMASLAAPPGQAVTLLTGEPVVIAGYNGPRQTVVSGPVTAVDRVCARAAAAGVHATRIAVSHAFHSPGVAPAAAPLDAFLAGVEFRPLTRTVYSTVTAHALRPDSDLRKLLVSQVTEPVRFDEALGGLASETDLLVEVGPGQVLTALAASVCPGKPAVPLETDGRSLAGLLTVVAAAYVLGAPVSIEELFHGRLARPLPLNKQFRFLASPCEAPARPGAGAIASLTVSTSTSPQPLSWSPHGPITAIVSAPGHDVVTDNDAAPGLEQDFGRDGEQGGRPPRDSLEVLRGLFAERAELPVPAVRDDTRPLDELHLSSIAVGEIMNRAARDLGVAVPALTSGYATSTLAELAMTLDDLAGTQLPDDAAGGQWQPPPGVAAWTRAFAVELVPAPALAPPRALAGAEGEWRVLATPGHPLAGPLSAALRTAGLGGGVLLLLPRECGEEHVPLMLEAAQAALRDGSQRFVVVQDERGAAALAKTLHLEAPSVRTTVIVLRLEEGMATDGIVASITNDVAATTAFSEVHYDDAGRRLVPVLRPVPGLADRDPNRDFPSAGVRFGPRDVVLATGGGKGITAECALALARHSGAALAIVGRSDPGHDAELAANLRRMSSAGARVQYFQADVTSASAMRSAVAQIQDALGAVTAVMHGAGHNRPVPLGSLSEEDFQATLAPKAGGLDAVLAAVDPSAIRLLVNFGSIIGRAGLRGQADYATANDWLTIRTREFQAHGCFFLRDVLFPAFWSCGEVEPLDGVLVVAGEVVLVAVALLVVAHVVVKVAVDDDGAYLEDVLGTSGRPSRACNSEPVFDDEPAGALDHARGDRPSLLECLVVFHVLLVVVQVGDGPVEVGEVEVPLAGVRAGLRGDGLQGGGDGFRAAVQDAQQLPVGPLAGSERVAGVQRCGGLADIAADVDVINQDRHLQAAFPRAGLDGGDLLLVPVDEEHPLPHALGVAAAGLVERRGDHVLDGLGDRRRDPFIAGFRAGARLAAGGRGRDVLRLADGGGEVRDGDDLGHLLDPGPGAVVLPGVPAVLRAHRDALAVALHHDHVRRRLLFLFGVAGAFLVEVAGPGGEAAGDPGQLGVADLHPGPVLDDLLGLPVSRDGQVEGDQGAQPHRVRVTGHHRPGISGVQVLLAPVPVGHPGDPHGTEDAGQAPLLAGFHGPVPDPRRAGDLRRPLLPGGVQGERGLQQPPLQLPALPADRLLALPVVQEPRFLRRPGQQPRELPCGIRQRRRQLPVHRGLAPVLQDLPHRHQQPCRHRPPPMPAVNDFRPSSRKRPRNPRNRQSPTAPDTSPESHQQGR